MYTDKCTVEGCNNIKKTKYYCDKHYTQIVRHGRLTPEREYKKEKAICSIENCDKKVYAKILCRWHWMLQRKQKRQEEFDLGNQDIKICKVDSCNEIVLAKGYCRRHYKQYYTNGKITQIEKQICEKNPIVCQVEDCNNKPLAKGYCQKHYEKFRKYGDHFINIFQALRSVVLQIVTIGIMLRGIVKSIMLNILDTQKKNRLD